MGGSARGCQGIRAQRRGHAQPHATVGGARHGCLCRLDADPPAGIPADHHRGDGLAGAAPQRPVPLAQPRLAGRRTDPRRAPCRGPPPCRAGAAAQPAARPAGRGHELPGAGPRRRGPTARSACSTTWTRPCRRRARAIRRTRSRSRSCARPNRLAAPRRARETPCWTRPSPASSAWACAGTWRKRCGCGPRWRPAIARRSRRACGAGPGRGQLGLRRQDQQHRRTGRPQGAGVQQTGEHGQHHAHRHVVAGAAVHGLVGLPGLGRDRPACCGRTSARRAPLRRQGRGDAQHDVVLRLLVDHAVDRPGSATASRAPAACAWWPAASAQRLVGRGRRWARAPPVASNRACWQSHSVSVLDPGVHGADEVALHRGREAEQHAGQVEREHVVGDGDRLRRPCSGRLEDLLGQRPQFRGRRSPGASPDRRQHRLALRLALPSPRFRADAARRCSARRSRSCPGSAACRGSPRAGRRGPCDCPSRSGSPIQWLHSAAITGSARVSVSIGRRTTSPASGEGRSGNFSLSASRRVHHAERQVVGRLLARWPGRPC